MKLSDYITFHYYSIDSTVITQAIFKIPDGESTVVEIKGNLKSYLKQPKDFRRKMKCYAIRALFLALARRVIQEMGLDE